MSVTRVTLMHGDRHEPQDKAKESPGRNIAITLIDFGSASSQ